MNEPPPVWFDERYVPRRALSGESSCSIAVVGGGIVGVCAAYFLAKRGCEVALLEKESIASGASGRNAGFLLQGLHIPYGRALKAHGRDRSKTLWRLSLDNHALLRGLVEKESIACDYAARGSFRVACSEKEFDVICQSVKRLNQDGFRAELVLPSDLNRRLHGAGLSGGAYYPDDGEFHPVRFTRGLAAAAERAGARIYERSPLTKLDGTTLRTKDGAVTADMVLLATNAYAPLQHAFFKEVVAPVRGQCLVTERFHDRILPAPVYANWGLDYFRQLPDGRFLMGGGRHVSTNTEYTYKQETTEPIQEFLEGFLHEHFPVTRNLAVTHRWAGIMGFSCDDLPSVGPLPGSVDLYTAAGFHGHGLGFGVVAAKMVSEMMLDGRTEYPSRLFSPRRHSL